MTCVLVVVGWTGLALIDMMISTCVAIREICQSRRRANDADLQTVPDWDR